MRDYTGIDYASMPPPYAPDFQPRVRRMLGDIDYFLRDLSRGVARINNGQVPDGSGNQIGNNGTLTNYWFKPGISDPFTAFMSVASGGGGTISSTAHDTKGKILLGSSSGYDEANIRLGIGTQSPSAMVHISGTGTTIYARPTAISGSRNNWLGSDGGTTNLQTYINETTQDTGGSTYITETGFSPGTAIKFTLWAAGAVPVSGSPTIQVQIITKRDTPSAGTEQLQFILRHAATTVTTQLSGVASTSFSAFNYTLSAGEVTSLITTGAADDATIEFAVIGIGTSGYDIAHVQLAITTGTTQTIARWDTNSVQTGRITTEGYLESQRLNLTGTTSGTVTLSGGTSPTSHTYVVPTAQGGASTVLTNDGSGNLSWASATVDTARTWSTLQKFKDTAFLVGDDGDITKAAIFSLGGATTGKTLTLASSHTLDRTLTFPNVTGTLSTIENAETISGTRNHTAQITYNHQTSAVPFVINTVPGDGAPLSDAASAMRFVDTVSGFALDLQVTSGAGMTANKTMFFPDGSGEIVLSGAVQNLGSKTILTSSTLTSTTASSGVAFTDSTTSTKKLRFVLSGSVGNNSVTLTNTAARNYGLGNLSGNLPVIGDDPPAVASGALGKVDLTGQTAGIGSTNLSNTPPAGLYRVDVYAACTTVSGSGAPTLDVNLAWTDVVGATNVNVTAEDGGATAFPLPLSATGRSRATVFMQVASGNIAYSTTINAASGSPQYALYIRVTYLY